MKYQPKNKIAVFFLVVFMSFIIAPTVVTTIDDTVDMSSFFSINEEEKEGFKLFAQLDFGDAEIEIFDLEINNLFEYRFKNYPKPHLNLIFPPPELIS